MAATLSAGPHLYATGSLANDGFGFRFRLRCPVPGVALTRVVGLRLDDADVPLADLSLDLGDGGVRAALDVSPEHPAPLAPRAEPWLHVRRGPLDAAAHELALLVEVAPFGRLEIRATDSVGADDADDADDAHAPTADADGVPPRVPHDPDPARDYTPEHIAERQRFVERTTGVAPRHIAHYSFDPAIVRGNIENFTGVAQVPLGFAGPLRVNGEHAQGDFLIPLATTEGTLVASYGRGMKLLSLAGGVTVTISGDHMQRAPAFEFDSARGARAFVAWANAHLAEIRAAAEATSRVGSGSCGTRGGTPSASAVGA
jgi:hydroxymethylglutaryl-CoA reductase (NADPH)